MAATDSAIGNRLVGLMFGLASGQPWGISPYRVGKQPESEIMVWKVPRWVP